MYKYTNTKHLPKVQYKHNKGQHLEQLARYNMTGEILPADNKPFWVSADVLNIQLKSGKAQACKGYDIDAYIERNAAEQYGFCLADESGIVIMSPAEYKEMVLKYAEPTYDTKGEPVLRFKAESDEMRGWLDVKLNGKTRYNARYWYTVRA